MQKIIGIAGFAQSGKNTLGSHIENRYGYMTDSFAAPIYKGLASILAMQPRELEMYKEEGLTNAVTGKTYREMLQTLGTEWGRDLIHPHIWVNLLEQRVKQHYRNVVITDVRFDNEAESIQRMGGKVIMVVRDHKKISENLHKSETSLTNFDFTLTNFGTIEELHKQFDKLERTL